MDKLKRYLLRHKDELDVDAPPDDAWEPIASKLSDGPYPANLSTMPGFPAKPPVSGRLVRYLVAACLIGLAGIGFWLVVRDQKVPVKATANSNGAGDIKKPAHADGTRRDTIRVREEPSGKELVRNSGAPKRPRHKAGTPAPVDPSDAIGVIDNSYSSLIDDQLRKLRATPLYAENGDYFSFYADQLKQMDQDENQVRSDIKTFGLTSEFLEQLINVYQQKLNLLNNLRKEVNKMNNKVRGKQTPSPKAVVHYLNI
ncbi:MAG TPA: hypothetical protein VGQ51_03190 [Puia sp.]|jgi:hypothetical protein|nr:hypothetical protein [Puia sp.]